MKQIRFFAVDDDLTTVLGEVELSYKLQYIKAGVFSVPEYEMYKTWGGLPNLSVATDESAIGCESYVVAESTAAIHVRSIALSSGKTNFCIDQLDNPDTVTLTPAGRWDDDVILYGVVGTASDATPSVELIKLFEKAFKKHFKKVKAFWVGPTAYALLTAGKTLTISTQSPKEFALSLD